MRDLLAQIASDARAALTEDIKPKDRFERAVVAALGEVTWDEAVRAINGHRNGNCNCWDCRDSSESEDCKS